MRGGVFLFFRDAAMFFGRHGCGFFETLLLGGKTRIKSESHHVPFSLYLYVAYREKGTVRFEYIGPLASENAKAVMQKFGHPDLERKLWFKYLFSRANLRMIFLKPDLNLDSEFINSSEEVISLFCGNCTSCIIFANVSFSTTIV